MSCWQNSDEHGCAIACSSVVELACGLLLKIQASAAAAAGVDAVIMK